jgi:hypothetical protein
VFIIGKLEGVTVAFCRGMGEATSDADGIAVSANIYA